MTNDRLEHVLAALRQHGSKGHRSGAGWMFQCPAHPDRVASLSVGVGHRHPVVLHCQAGCPPRDVLAAIGLTEGDLCEPHPNGTRLGTVVPIPVASPRTLTAAYDYPDRHGVLRYQVLRYEPKDFKQRRPDGHGGWLWNLADTPRLLYRLPETIAALTAGEPVFIVEGEKDVERLAAAGLAATCNSGGAGKWPEDAELTGVFTGATVFILPDNDAPGRRHAEHVARTLHPVANTVRMVLLPHGAKDVSDWLDHGGSVTELCALPGTVAPWTPTETAVVVAEQEDREPRRLSTANLLADPSLLLPPPCVLPYLAWAERITVLAGSWKSGKSTLVSHGVAHAVIPDHGRTFLGLPVPPGPWLWLALDEPLADLWRRLHGWGLTTPGPLEYYDHARPSLDRLSRDLAEMRAVGLVIDNLITFARGLVTDVRQAPEWEALFSDLRAMLRPTKTAAVAIHHTPYNSETPRPADSRQIGASADVVVTLVRPTTDTTTRKFEAIGRGVQFEHTLRYDGTGGYELSARPASLSVQIIEYIRQGHGPGVRQILDAVGGDGDMADRERKALLRQGVIVVQTDGAKKRHYLTGAAPQHALDPVMERIITLPPDQSPRT